MSKVSATLNQEVKKEQPKMSLKSLKDLIFIGKTERKVELGGFEFVLSSVTAEDQRTMISRLLRMPEDSRAFYAKIISLAFSIKTVNLTPLEMIEVDGNFEDVIEKKMHIIQSLQVSLVNKLYMTYEQLMSESNAEVDIEEVKK